MAWPEWSRSGFRFEDFWYEIKTTNIGTISVRISSVEQLDTNRLGQLCVVLLDEAGGELENVISLNSIIGSIRNLIEKDIEAIQIFGQRLDEIGYIDRREYSEDLFVLRKIHRFRVDQQFPCMRQVIIPASVSKVTYDLNIEALSSFKINDEVQ